MTQSTASGYIQAGKRLAMEQSAFGSGDWFVSHSPRNSNSYAEGQWDQWVDLALKILQHPATEVTRPAAYKAVQGVPTYNFYSECGRDLTDDELARLFPEGGEYS